MSELNELARDIPTWQDLPFGGRDEYVKLDANAAHAVASVLFEKGWRKPRTVNTVAELDALPIGSVVLDSRWGAVGKYHDGDWYNISSDVPVFNPALPTTILHEGRQNA